MRLQCFARRRLTPIVVFSALASPQIALLAAVPGRLAVAVAAALIVVSAYLVRGPASIAVIVLGAFALRVGMIGLVEGDQHAIVAAALGEVLNGNNPYGIGYSVSSPAGTAYAYGPLGFILWSPGVIVEWFATALVIGVLWKLRCVLTLALYAGLPFIVFETGAGINDYSAGALILLSLVALRSRPTLGSFGLAAAAAVKPYAAAWFLPAVGLAGIGGLAVITLGSVVLWSPIWAWWGIDSYVTSARDVENLRMWLKEHGSTRLTVDIPPLRYAVPLIMGVVGLAKPTWRATLLLGAAAFVAFFLFAPWAHPGYWVVIVPVVGVALEMGNPESQHAISTRAAGALMRRTVVAYGRFRSGC